MNTPKAIQSLADARIIEAESLCAMGHFGLAYYVAGYAVELYLKARICLILNIPDFFDFGNRKKFDNEDSITKPYKVHNFAQLLILSGLSAENKKMLEDGTFKKDWSELEIWSEKLRYEGNQTEADALTFIKSVKNYTTWIGQYL